MNDEPTEKYYVEGLWRRDATLLDDLRDAAREHPDRRAVVVYRVDGQEPTSLTYAELERAVERIAAGLARLGVTRGDVVTLQLPNCWQLLASCLACARIGAIAGPVPIIMRRRELEFITRLTESAVYIGPVEYRGFSHAQLSEEVGGLVPTIRHRVLTGMAGAEADAPGIAGALDFDTAMLADEPVPADVRESGPDDIAYVMFTSGTTGEPKGVMHSFNTLYATNRTQAEILQLSDVDVTAMGAPVTYNAGYTWNFVMPLVLGATSVHMDAWDPSLMLRVLEREQVTFFMGAPPFLVDLINEQREQRRDLSALRAFATGSAPIPPVLVEEARDVLGCRLYALWGMTENGAPTITRPEDPPMRAAESDGTPMPGMCVRIVDRAGAEVRPGEVGRLQVRGAFQCLGYFRRPRVYMDSLTEDGWFNTGDLARDDGHGGIRIAGREKDMISRGGVKIPVVEVEAALLRHPEVKDVAVIGCPDERLGERACAVIVANGHQPGMPEIRDHLAALGMAKQYWPERLEFVTELPRTPSGKVQKFKLREQISATQGG
jgi:cyclohexanecarboxylate-CoA ligase